MQPMSSEVYVSLYLTEFGKEEESYSIKRIHSVFKTYPMVFNLNYGGDFGKASLLHNQNKDNRMDSQGSLEGQSDNTCMIPSKGSNT